MRCKESSNTEGVGELQQRYIDGQEQHHKRVTFQDEFRAFLKEYEIEYDERYV